jgi:hypothetical protein
VFLVSTTYLCTYLNLPYIIHPYVYNVFEQYNDGIRIQSIGGKHNYEDSILLLKKNNFFHTIQLMLILLKLFCGYRLDC